MTQLADLHGTFELDAAGSVIAFVARHVMVTKVRGTFSRATGMAVVDAAHLADSSLRVSIDVASVDTGSDERDSHLRSADFFNVDQYPVMTFVATGFALTGRETVDVTGDLTIRSVTQSLTIPFTYGGDSLDPDGTRRVRFRGAATVNRKDWGLVWNAAIETGGVVVADKVELEFNVSATEAD